MTILSNGFPTNMPDAENVSQGGPANFARLFTSYITANTKDRWIGVMLQAESIRKPKLQKIFSFPRREYYKLYAPKSRLKALTQAKIKQDPSRLFKGSIDQLASLIKRQKPDVVFLNGFGIFNWLLLKAAEQTATPVVIQHAGIWTKELEIHKSLYTVAGRKMMAEMEKDSSRLASAEVFLNEWSKDYYRRHVAKRADKQTYIIPLPFDFNLFKGLSRRGQKNKLSLPGFDHQKFNIGVIARWDEIKNHQAILALAKEAKRLKLPWAFHVVTSIPDLPKYEKARRSYEREIKVIPSLDRDGISRFCRTVDLLLQPSLFDVSPTVVLEAVALNTPIVISPNVGYVHDFKTHGAEPWVIETKNAASMVKHIIRLARQPMPMSIKKQLRKAHDHKRVFNAYLKVFSQVGR